MSILNRFRLDDRVAVVTGASSGLGVRFATALAEAGADVVIAARRVDRLAQTRELVEATGRRALAVACDVTDPDACTAVAEAAIAEFGRVDVLVNNAGIGTAVPALRETPEQFRAVVDINLHGTYWMAQACARVMHPGSSIINISSILGLTTAGLPQAAYAASKSAVVGLTRDLAQQWTGRRGIRVNAIAPGFFASEMTDQYDKDYIENVILPRTLTGAWETPTNSAPQYCSSPATPAATSPAPRCRSKADSSPAEPPAEEWMACSARDWPLGKLDPVSRSRGGSRTGRTLTACTDPATDPPVCPCEVSRHRDRRDQAGQIRARVRNARRVRPAVRDPAGSATAWKAGDFRWAVFNTETYASPIR